MSACTREGGGIPLSNLSKRRVPVPGEHWPCEKRTRCACVRTSTAPWVDVPWLQVVVVGHTYRVVGHAAVPTSRPQATGQTNKPSKAHQPPSSAWKCGVYRSTHTYKSSSPGTCVGRYLGRQSQLLISSPAPIHLEPTQAPSGRLTRENGDSVARGKGPQGVTPPLRPLPTGSTFTTLFDINDTQAKPSQRLSGPGEADKKENGSGANDKAEQTRVLASSANV